MDSRILMAVFHHHVSIDSRNGDRQTGNVKSFKLALVSSWLHVRLEWWFGD